MFMSSCTVFVFLSLMEYALVNVILGDMVDHRPTGDTMMRRITRKITIRKPRPSNVRKRVSIVLSVVCVVMVSDGVYVSSLGVFEAWGDYCVCVCGYQCGSTGDLFGWSVLLKFVK